MIIPLSILLFLLILNLLYWVFVFSKFSRFHDLNSQKIGFGGIINHSAILIAVKNEEENILKNLPSLFDQYPKDIEFVVVDDYSTDNSVEKLNQIFALEEIKVLKNDFNPGKKQAISYAISKIDKEYLLLTDADCFVKSKYWAKKMFEKFDSKTSIVLGYSPYTGSSLLHRFIRFETFIAALQYFSYYLLRIPYMGVGRNMAIRKSLFVENDGYEKHIDIKSGNDDLFVNDNASFENTSIQVDPDSFVYSTPSDSLTGFIKQKSRHVSTSFRYKFLHKLLLGIYSFSHIGFYIALIFSFFVLPFYVSFSIWFFRLLIIYLTAYKSFIKLKENDLMIYLPILDFFMFLYYTFIGIYYFFASKNKW